MYICKKWIPRYILRSLEVDTDSSQALLYIDDILLIQHTRDKLQGKVVEKVEAIMKKGHGADK